MREISENTVKGFRRPLLGICPVPIVCHKGCMERSWDCHAKCERYKAYREACDLALHERYLNQDVIEAVTDRIRQRERIERKRR